MFSASTSLNPTIKSPFRCLYAQKIRSPYSLSYTMDHMAVWNTPGHLWISQSSKYILIYRTLFHFSLVLSAFFIKNRIYTSCYSSCNRSLCLNYFSAHFVSTHILSHSFITGLTLSLSHCLRTLLLLISSGLSLRQCSEAHHQFSTSKKMTAEERIMLLCSPLSFSFIVSSESLYGLRWFSFCFWINNYFRLCVMHMHIVIEYTVNGKEHVSMDSSFNCLVAEDEFWHLNE